MNKTIWIFAGAAVCALGLASSAMAQSATFVEDSNGNISVGTTLAQNSAGFASVTNGANGPITTASTNNQFSEAQAQLTYNFRIVVPGGPFTQPISILPGTFLDVPLEIGFASTATLAPGASEAQARTDLLVQSAIQDTAFEFTQDCEGDFGLCGSTGPLTSDFDYHLVFADFNGGLHSGALGFVVMTAFTRGEAFAQLDPMINFAPQFALDHPDWTITMDAVPGLDGVPEPASWALMIAGFGLAGAALRRRRAVKANGFGLLAAMAATAVGLGSGAARAEVTDGHYSAFVGVGDPSVTTNSQNLGNLNLPPPSPGSVSFTANSTDANALPTRLASFATTSATTGNDPEPHVDAFAQSYGEYIASGQAGLNFSIRGYVGGDTTGVTDIPLFIQGHVVSSVLGATGRSEASLGLSGYVNPDFGSHTAFDDFCTASGGGCVDEDFTYAFSLDTADSIAGAFDGFISMSVHAFTNYFGDPNALNEDVITARAYVDPIIYIDPVFLAAHPGTTLIPDGSFLFDVPPGGSGSGGGGGAGDVPEPASWALMIAGFGLAGAALRRRRGAITA